jgi:hypothetical protein
MGPNRTTYCQVGKNRTSFGLAVGARNRKSHCCVLKDLLSRWCYQALRHRFSKRAPRRALVHGGPRRTRAAAVSSSAHAAGAGSGLDVPLPAAFQPSRPSLNTRTFV